VTSAVGTLYAWGAQLEEGTTATPYIKTTSQALAAPRFDHDPVTKESLGLLVEEARTNLLAYSEFRQRLSDRHMLLWIAIGCFFSPATEIANVQGQMEFHDGVGN
jgi:hypothetical protein